MQRWFQPASIAPAMIVAKWWMLQPVVTAYAWSCMHAHRVSQDLPVPPIGSWNQCMVLPSESPSARSLATECHGKLGSAQAGGARGLAP